MKYLKETLLDNLCRAHGRQGGTIYQYYPTIGGEGFRMMEREWQELCLCGIEFNTPKAFEKLAKKHYVKMEIK